MEKFFYPKTVAVIGVSENPANLGRGILHNMMQCGYQGKMYPVGPRGGNVYGLPVLKHLKEVPEPVDLAVVLTPARFVPQVVEDCGHLGITRIVVESGGFAELGEQGRALEEEIKSLIKQYNLRLVGPNGIGLINMEIGLGLPFSQLSPIPRKGHLSVVAQSGGVGMHVMAWMTKEGLGLNKFVSLGNKIDVKENEVLAYLLEDPGTQGIYLYIEGLEDGRGLLELAKRSEKPIFLHLPNVGAETAAIAMSHTASLASDEKVVHAACRQANIIWVKSQADFLIAAKMVGQPPVKGNRLVVMSRSGGEAVIAAYGCRQWGFTLPPLKPQLAQFIHDHSRSKIIKPGNPIDLGDIFDFKVYTEVMTQLCADPEVDAVLLNYGPVYDTERHEAREMARALVAKSAAAKKPLAICVCATLEEEEFFRDTLGLPVFHFPGQALRALAMSRIWSQRPPLEPVADADPGFDRQAVAEVLTSAGPSGFLELPTALTLAANLGITVAPWRAVSDPHSAAAAAGELGYPVCLKLAAPSLVHKTEAGGVLLNLQTPEEVASGAARLAEVAAAVLPSTEPWQVLVMSQVQEGEEVILGANRDPSFGPVIAFGAGGVWTEILEDVALRIAPINLTEAYSQIMETRFARILKGVRGRPPADLEALSRALVALAHLMLEFPQIQEVDLNPIRVFPGKKGLVALDARVRLK